MLPEKFDDLTQSLASGVSRRQVLKVFFAGIVSFFIGDQFTTPLAIDAAGTPKVSTEICINALDGCVSLAVTAVIQGFQGCVAHCSADKVNSSECQLCVEAIGHQSLTIIDNCLIGKDQSCAEELLVRYQTANSGDQLFIGQSYSESMSNTGHYSSYASLVGLNECDKSQLDTCTEDKRNIYLITLTGCWLALLFSGGTATAGAGVCAAVAIAKYVYEGWTCIRDYGCTNGTTTCCGGVCCDHQSCVNDVCCDGGDSCGSVCCATDEKCIDGTCQSTCGGTICATDEVCCDDMCADVNNDPRNCGNCGIQCTEDQICVAGVCKTCDTSKCMAPGFDGTTGQFACISVCGRNERCCNGTCVNIQTDAENCGRCGRHCDYGCAGGNCCDTGASPCLGKVCCRTNHTCIPCPHNPSAACCRVS